VRCAETAEPLDLPFGSCMPGHVGQNDTDFTYLQEGLNAPISRPLRPNFAISPIFDQLWGPTSPKWLGVAE